MERGLYGQAESDANVKNASSEMIADLDGEGLKEYDGIKTEAAFRATLAIHRKDERDGAREEARGERLHATAAPIIRNLATRVARAQQQEALQKQADTLEEMKAVGYSDARVEAAYSTAAAISMNVSTVKASRKALGIRKGKITNW